MCSSCMCVQLPGAVVPGQLPATSSLSPTEPEHGKLSLGGHHVVSRGGHVIVLAPFMGKAIHACLYDLISR